MVPAVGIEPTSSALQADANPSQLHWDNVEAVKTSTTVVYLGVTSGS